MTFNQILGLLGGWTAITSAIIYFLSNRLADKLNIKWKESADRNIATLQSELTRNNNTLNSLITLYAANNHQAQERRIKAIEILWINLLEFKAVIPSTMRKIYNVYDDKEIEEYWTRDSNNEIYLAGRRALEEVDYTQQMEKHKCINTIDRERPFIGEKVWYYYDVYQTFLSRLSLLAVRGIENHQFQHWHKDELLKDLFERTLNKDELNYIYSNRSGSLRITSAFLENKLLQEINKTLSGETFSETALERVKKFESVLKANAN